MALSDLPRRGRAIANEYGLTEAVGGLLLGLILESIAEGAYDALAHKPASSTSFGALLVGLIGLWIGFLAAAFAALARQPAAVRTGPLRARLRESIGLGASWIDLPLGIVVGLASQFALIPVASLPLLPFVPHLYTRLGDRAHSLTSGVYGAGLVVLALFICVGSPLVEEIFFRGVLLRGLLGAGRRRLPVGLVIVPVILDGVLFGLAHFEALQLLGLASFGVVLATLAYRTGRLGAGIVAHVTFNTATIIAIAAAR